MQLFSINQTWMIIKKGARKEDILGIDYQYTLKVYIKKNTEFLKKGKEKL